LAKPLALLMRMSSDGAEPVEDRGRRSVEYAVTALIKQKIVFSRRPMPVAEGVKNRGGVDVERLRKE